MKKVENKIILFFVAMIFFILYNFLNFTTPRQFNSPDETMHYAFIQNFADQNALKIEHSQDYGEYKDFIFPRSTFSSGNAIIPVGFIGLNIIYGLIAKVAGMNLIVYLTSLLTILAMFCFYFLIKKIFNEKTALFSSLLFLSQPVLWYYNERSLFPNVPFLDFLIMGSFFLLYRPIKAKLYNDFLGILGILTALLVRPSEVVWVGLAFAIIWFAYRKKVSWQSFTLWFILGALFLVLYVVINQKLFNGALISYSASESFVVNKWHQFIFPFGINLGQVLRAGYFYFVKMFWWLTIPAMLGIGFFKVAWLKKKLEKKQKVFFLIFTVVSLYLFIFYGSYTDVRFDLKTIGISYTRYWLPIFILSLPFIAYFWQKVSDVILSGARRAKSKDLVLKDGIPRLRFATLGMTLLVGLGTLALNYNIVFNGIDGVKAAKTNILYGSQVREYVLQNTPKYAIIATQTEDKVFWPDRQVMTNILNPDISHAVFGLHKMNFSLFYFTHNVSEEEFEKIKKHYEDYGLKMELEKNFGEHSLYRFEGLK